MSDETMATDEEPVEEVTEEEASEEAAVAEAPIEETVEEALVVTLSKAESLLSYLRECVANGHDVLVRDRSGQNTVIDIENF